MAALNRPSARTDIAEPLPQNPGLIPPDVRNDPLITPIPDGDWRQWQTPPLEHPDFDFGPLSTPIPEQDWRDYIMTRSDSEPIGSFELPENWRYGTAPSGNYAHQAIADWYAEQFPDVRFIFSVRPGQHGVDIEVPRAEDARLVGFNRAEIKPNTESGERTLGRQLDNWRLRASQVQPITYDQHGNIRYGFHY